MKDTKLYLEYYKKLKNMNEKDYIENILTYNLSPLIAGLKPASTITLDNKLYLIWRKYGPEYIGNLGLKSIEVNNNSSKNIIIIYNEYEIIKTINDDRNREFLIEYGYTINNSVNSIFKQLKERYKSDECPHEIGIFLGIPIEDVIGFINNNNNECLGCGYWKVYANLDQANRIFSKYNNVKVRALKYILSGIKKDKLIKYIKS